ncbi:transglycosylase domain-containing protein [Nocardia cyriacigeorgica]|uniref:transglycosylase domain-containing protein n=2 Tax=Nocardia cyriacigeorgica TaxID=135487 RepID=UPI000CE9B002|nr:transglycosylase domain-containing protein [Nocardia cyriacigeorgica]AVH21599.1 penicillin-binding protein [Nocardia cyriacigeorgica]MBF6321061.1 transglycosylase domain-containing protein [Nocardia cyriacigeorgica]MBF6495244.1 transglycosylase domain-containing protein [Nocardia cyriacigeorgica]PPJ12664.1 penicillin-binding protein [Nocardia cyriacigeorgica]
MPGPNGPRPGPNGPRPGPNGRPAPQGGRGPQGGPPPGNPRGPLPPHRPGPPPGRAPQGAPPPGRAPQGRPGPNPAPNSAQSTQKIARPGEGAKPPSAQATQKISRPASLSEAVSQRDRKASSTGPRPAARRPVAGAAAAASNTGERRAQSRSGPPSGPPPRRGGGDGDGPDGPGGRRPGAKKKSPWRIVRRTIYVLIALAIVVPSTVFLIAYSTVSVPQPGDLKTNQVATIYAADGTTEISKVVPPEGNRTEVTIDQVPPHVRNAVTAAEDRDFYTNPGFSVSGFARAARDNLLGKESAGGGSTITQQYVKNAMVGDERSLNRKLKELVISAKMARQWSKDEILAAYLNTIYFGRGAYGIDAAAKAYFDKPVQDLTVAEGAVLAATIQLPSSLDPEQNPEGAKTRWNYVLDGMVSEGNLPAAERKSMQYPAVRPLSSLGDRANDDGPEGLIKQQVLRELSAAGISEQQLNTAGLQITTTIDPKAQQAALDAVAENMQGEPEKLRTAVVSIDPKSGAVRAYYGGKDGQGYDFANAGLQTGSSFKVFGLAQNLEMGIPLSQMYDSSPLTVHGIKISNVEGESCGMCTIAEALKRSLNTSFYRMQLDMQNGPQKIADMAHKLGIPEEIPGVGKTLTEPDGSGPNNGIVLGQYQARVLDMASAYATLAASGKYHAPHFIQRVVTADGEVLLDRGEVAGEQRVSEAVADNVTAAMKPIAAYSRNHGLAGGRESAAKTGTAQLGDTGENKDAWMVGYTPSLSTAVWVGTEQGEPLRNYGGAMIYGSSLPSDIWKDTMDGALEGTPKETFPKPAPIKGQAGVPEWTAPYTAPSTTEAPPFQPPVVITPSQVEILPGITIPVPGVQPNPQAQVRPQPQQPSNSGPLPGQPTAPADGSPSTGRGQSGEDSSDSGEDSGGGGGGGTGGGQGAEDSGGTSGAPPGRSR